MSNDTQKDAPMVEAAGAMIHASEAGWRRISGQENRRDMAPMKHASHQEVSEYLWRTNALANRLVELPVAYLLADGVSLKVEDDEAQDWLNEFWHDPINQMDVKLPKKVRDLSIYGEQCYPVYVNEGDGSVRLGYLDPRQIATVVTDPDNIEQPIGIVTTKDKKGNATRYRVIVNGNESVFTPRTQEIRESFGDGGCFFFSVNNLSTATRGQSDLLQVMDWLDALDEVMFSEIERWKDAKAVLWDVLIENATQEQINERKKTIRKPRDGDITVHNAAETWSVLSPSLDAGGITELARLFKNHIIAARTLPEHWFGGGGDVNRATAGEMGEPTFKVMTMRQTEIGYMLSQIGAYVIRSRQSRANGATKYGDPDFIVSAQWPEMTARDTTKYATALPQIVGAAAIAMTNDILSKESALELIAVVADQLGVKIDPEMELEKIADEITAAEEADSFAFGTAKEADDDE